MAIFDSDYNQNVIIELSVAEIKLVAQLLHLHLIQHECSKAGDKLMGTLRQQTECVSREPVEHGVWATCPFGMKSKKTPQQMDKPWYIPVEKGNESVQQQQDNDRLPHL